MYVHNCTTKEIKMFHDLKVNYSPLTGRAISNLVPVDIFFNLSTSHDACSPNSIPLRPQMTTPKPQLNLSKLLKQQSSRIALQHTHHLRNTYFRWSRNKQIHMIAMMNSNSQQHKATLISNRLK